ncbi:uncharacterized protein LOC118229626 [Anguilla anguilla]|uniref:uncharacterized protein LOC118229626 n=1 Tax=Anguilla anguilla TaxID=7936 RepID=UPI0015B1CED3|nr:uncharacterized protein LOC118229626 [Anguilla anguilla]
MMFYCLLLLFSTIVDNSFQDEITPAAKEVHVLEGSSVTLSCTYTAAANYLYWYRQYARSKPEFLIRVAGTLSKKDEKGRFNVTNDKDNKHVHLEFTAEVTDSALYYCALQPTVTAIMILQCLSLIFSTMVGDSFQDSITPLKDTVHAMEDSNVSLSCTYTGIAGLTKYLHWYRQYDTSKPEFLILIGDVRGSETKRDGRFNVKLENSRVDLEISSAEVTDSALYYCALQPTVTGNPSSLYKNLTALETSCNIRTLQCMKA